MTNNEYQIKAMRTKPTEFTCKFDPNLFALTLHDTIIAGTECGKLQKTFQGHGIDYSNSPTLKMHANNVAVLNMYRAQSNTKHHTMPGQLTHALLGMISETGELSELYIPTLEEKELDTVKFKSELGDLIWFIAEAADALDTSIEELMQNNILKLQRRYPEGFDPERSLHREKGDI